MTWLTRTGSGAICAVFCLAGAGADAVGAPSPKGPTPMPPRPAANPTATPAAPGAIAVPFSTKPSSDPRLTFVTPSLLEISWVSPDQAPRGLANLTNASALPASAFLVEAQGRPIAVNAVGIRRRAAYAPFKQRDLRVGTSVFLELASPVPDGEPLTVKASGTEPWPHGSQLSATNDPNRWSPAIHVNQTGYLPNAPKKAMVGYYLGTSGEADLPKLLAGNGALKFSVVNAAGQPVYSGELTSRADEGFPYPAYQKVMQADFGSLTAQGSYTLSVPGLGVSYPFVIGESVAGALARTYALGLYHQRCGSANALPFTRFTHRECHMKPAAVPDTSSAHENSNWTLETETENVKDQPRHTARRMKSVNDSLYPFVNRGPVDVHGGHHDAGDYSKYTINSAAFIHLLTTACDALPGVAALDNLGVPESGDGKGDVLQEAKWEADFLARMQDADGGFYFLVYPKGRRYEDNVTPDNGDPQVVFPKTTAATAAAAAALAQCASSPEFKKQFPEAVAGYLDKARKGWAFLTNAIALHGKDGSYQKITHYGDEFMHDDELAWAAVELFLATGEPEFQQKVAEWFKPNDPDFRKWGWWRLFDAQGNAVRSYALAVKTGRMRPDQLDANLSDAAQQEVIAAGEDQDRRSSQSAYGTSFPEETKRVRSAGWYFSQDAAFDAEIASRLKPEAGTMETVAANINYEQGANPVNVNYLTGLGARRQFEIVHQYAQNDRRALPPTGIPIGNIQGGISWIDLYKDEPAKFSVPSDEDEQAPYPFYDRWADAFNLSQEFIILNQARGLAVSAWLMAQTQLKDQPWKPAAASISGLPQRTTAGQVVRLQLTPPAGIDLAGAVVIWEAAGTEPHRGLVFDWRPSKHGPSWVEAEAQLPDGRRIFAAAETVVNR